MFSYLWMPYGFILNIKGETDTYSQISLDVLALPHDNDQLPT